MVDFSSYQNDWTPDLIKTYYDHLHSIAVDEWGYKIYPNQIEIVNSEGMLEAYTSHGLPMFYPHWSVGKSYQDLKRTYKRGQMGLAYEMVLNSDPCINYLMEENTLTMQILVLGHAAMGHNHFFRNNFMMRQWSHADYIVSYLKFAKDYVEQCEERYGFVAVERVLDAAHALRFYAVDKYKTPKKRKGYEAERLKARIDFEQKTYDRLLDFGKNPETEKSDQDDRKIEPTENLLYFIEKNSPILKDWERELVRIVRKIWQYLYPNINTALMNEGFATLSHALLIEELDKRKLLNEAAMLEFCHMHSNVLWQRDMSPLSNPYALGYAIYRDIIRICTNPTKEDGEWFPEIAGCKDYWKVIFDAVVNFKDESFVLQFMSPKVIRDFKMMSILDRREDDHYKVTAIHDEQGYRRIREIMSENWNPNVNIPRIEVQDVRWKADRTLVLRYHPFAGRSLDTRACESVLGQVKKLWGFPVEMVSK